jgi:hypothetical protein
MNKIALTALMLLSVFAIALADDSFQYQDLQDQINRIRVAQDEAEWDRQIAAQNAERAAWKWHMYQQCVEMRLNAGLSTAGCELCLY